MGYLFSGPVVIQPISKSWSLRLLSAAIAYAALMNLTHDHFAHLIGESWDLFLDAGMLVVFLLAVFQFVVRPLSAAADSYRGLATSVLENARDGVVVFNTSGGIEASNPAAERLLGWSKEELAKESVARMFTPSGELGWSEDAERNFFSSLLASIGGTVETFALQRNGNALPVEVSVFEIDFLGKRRLCAMIHDISERKRAEEALQVSEERFRQVAESAGEWIWEVDAEGLYTYSSPVVEKILGYTPEELVGKMHFYDLFASEVRDEYKAGALSAFARKESFGGFVNPNIHKDGKTVIFETNGVPVLDATGTLLGYRGADLDISERKQAEDALRQAEAKYRIVADNTYDWEFWVNPQGRFEYCSPSCKRVTGYDPGEFTANSELLGSIVHPDDRARFDLHRQTTKEGVSSDEMEFRIVRPDGKVRWITHVCQPVFDQEGVFIGTRGSNRDTTDRKRSEDALRESEATLRSITESAQDAIVMTDPEGRISYWNPAAERIFGFGPDEALGRSLHELLVPARFHAARDAAFPEFQKTGSGNALGKTLELRALHKGGQEFDVALSLSGVQIDGAWHAVGIVRDITKEKRLEQEVLKQTAQEKQLEGIHQAAITLQHEINNPLAGVLGLAELLHLQLPGIIENLSAEKGKTLQGSVSEIIALSNRIAGVVRKLREVYNPILTLHPVDADYSAEMIDLHVSD